MKKIDKIMKIERKVKVVNDQGLHTRPAAMIVKILQNCQNNVYFTHKRQTVNAKSILSILMLAAKKKAQVKISVEGDDHDILEATMSELLEAFKSGFGE